MRVEKKVACMGGWSVDIDIDVAGAAAELRARADRLDAGEIEIEEVVSKSVVHDEGSFLIHLPADREMKLGKCTTELQKLMKAAGLHQQAERLAIEVFRNTDDQLLEGLVDLEKTMQMFSAASYLERLMSKTTYELLFFEDQALLLQNLKDMLLAEVKRRAVST